METNGKYLRQEEKTANEEEVFDKELQEMFGERYRDATELEAEYELTDETEGAEIRKGWKRIRAACGLIAGVGLLFYMVMTGKIDTAYGVLFTAGVSGVCGYHLK